MIAAWWPRAASRAGPLHPAMVAVLVQVSVLALVGCGGGSGDGGGGSGGTADALAETSSLNPNCAGLSGATAVYFDFESGFLIDLPFTPLLEATGGLITGGDLSLWRFPPGYTGQALASGVIVQRGDGQVFFKHATNEPLLTDPASAFDAQLATALATFQLRPDTARLVCGRDTPFFRGPLPARLLSGWYEAGSFTLLVAIQAIDATGVRVVSSRVAIGPTAEFDRLAGEVFLPMVWEQFPGGSGPRPQCADDVDNDGDGAIDFPGDPQCQSADDDDESG